VLKRVMG